MTPEQEAAIRADEHARIRAAAQAKARKLHEMGRALYAQRWRSVDAWLRTVAPTKPTP